MTLWNPAGMRVCYPQCYTDKVASKRAGQAVRPGVVTKPSRPLTARAPPVLLCRRSVAPRHVPLFEDLQLTKTTQP
jgi:hypothetical protein